MSRYGNTPISLPKGVEIKKEKEKVLVKGPKGQLSVDVKDGVMIDLKEENIFVRLEENSSLSSAMHGLYRSLINNMVIGVSKGFEKKLTLIGVGYRAAVTGNSLNLEVGFSNPSKLDIPKGIQIKVEKGTIIVEGIDKQMVGQFAATIRSKRPPEPYKGKGIRYEGEYVRKKAGKAAKGKAG